MKALALTLFVSLASTSAFAGSLSFKAECEQRLDRETQTSVRYNPILLGKSFSNAEVLHNLNLDQANFLLAVTEKKSVPDANGVVSEIYDVQLVRSQKQFEVSIGEDPKARGVMSAQAHVTQTPGKAPYAVWYSTSAKKVASGFPIKLELDYSVKTGTLTRQNIQLSCSITAE